jgi:predicted transposase YdaD
MLFTEWNWDDALAVRYEEGKEEGKEDRDKEIAFNALNALKEGIPIETIQKITGMDIETISSLASQ